MKGLLHGVLIIFVGFWVSVYVGNIMHYAWVNFAPTTFEISKGSFIAFGIVYGLLTVKLSDIPASDAKRDISEDWYKLITLVTCYALIHLKLIIINAWW